MLIFEVKILLTVFFRLFIIVHKDSELKHFNIESKFFKGSNAPRYNNSDNNDGDYDDGTVV